MCYPNIALLHGEDSFKKFHDPQYVYNLKMLEAKPGFIINCVNVLCLKRFIY